MIAEFDKIHDDLFKSNAETLRLSRMIRPVFEIIKSFGIFGARSFFNTIKIFHNLRDELFTPNNRGGLVILFILFFTSFVTAVVIWHDQDQFLNLSDLSAINASSANTTAAIGPCPTLKYCWLSVLRLTFYDGTGLDLLALALQSRATHLFLLLLVYLIFTGIILLNALLGIFVHVIDPENSALVNGTNSVAPAQDEESAFSFQQCRAFAAELSNALETYATMDAASLPLMLPGNQGPEILLNARLEMDSVISEGSDQPGTLPVSSGLEHNVFQVKNVEDPRKRWDLMVFFGVCFLCSVAEIVLVSMPPNLDAQAIAQYVVLTISTVLFVLSIYATWLLTLEAYTPAERAAVEEAERAAAVSADTEGGVKARALAAQAGQKKREALHWQYIVHSVLSPASRFEAAFLLIGWVGLLCGARGMASLRCFRVFRVLWTLDMYKSTASLSASSPSADANGDGLRLAMNRAIPNAYAASPGPASTTVSCPAITTSPDPACSTGMVLNMLSAGLDLVLRVLAGACAQCLTYFKKLGTELEPSSESQGGIVLVGIWFYLTYVVAIVIWVGKGGFTYIDPTMPDQVQTDQHCSDLRNCWMNVLRLSLFDGNGFDLLSAVAYSGSWWLVLVLILYMCFSAMVLLNALVGVFGTSFSSDPPPVDDASPPSRNLAELATEIQRLNGQLRKTLDRIVVVGGGGLAGSRTFPVSLSS